VSDICITDFNTLRVAVETNGFQGGDSGHGSRTVLELGDEGSTDIQYAVRSTDEGDRGRGASPTRLA